jgi:hypothetical protein
MKLYHYYLEQLNRQIPNSVDLNSGTINVNIVFDFLNEKGQKEKNKEISFQISSDVTVRKLSQEINKRSDNQMTIPTYDPFYSSDEPLYKIYDPDKIEFRVHYIPNDHNDKTKHNYPYKVLISGYKPGIKEKFKNIIDNFQGYFYKK